MGQSAAPMFGRKGSPRLAISGAALALVLAPSRAGAQNEVADLREDVRGLTQRLGELSLRVEQLEHDNAELRARLAAEHGRDVVTAAQLNGAVADLNTSIKAAVDGSRDEILHRVARQMEVLAKQTNAALDALARSQAAPAAQVSAAAAAPAPAGKADFGTAYPKEGITYTVQKGDSIGAIAKKTGSKAQDIIDANKLLDPSRIQAGQTLFIPGGK